MKTVPSHLPKTLNTEAEIEEVMTIPSPALVEMMKRLGGDILILGIAGKMGITLGLLAVKACKEAGVKKKVIGVSRFSEKGSREHLNKLGIETISCDLLDQKAVQALPQVPNIIFMAGRKFGTNGSEALTWAMNTTVPAYVGDHFTKSRIVAFSTGCVYPLVPVDSGGATEDVAPNPPGEYAQSCLGRERVFSHFSNKHKSPLAIIRLNYAIDPRYGVLLEVGTSVWKGAPLDLTMGHVNVIWQGDANAQALLSLEHASSPPCILNVTGPETVSIRYLATQFGKLMGKKPVLQGQEGETAWLNNSAKAARLFGYPSVPLQQMIEWVAHWIQNEGRTLNKPTHFEVRDGKF